MSAAAPPVYEQANVADKAAYVPGAPGVPISRVDSSTARPSTTIPPHSSSVDSSPKLERSMSLSKVRSNGVIDEKTAKVVYEKSPGILRIEAITSTFTRWHLAWLFFAIFLVAYCYGLDGTLRYTYQVFALADWAASAQISTITVVRSIVAAAAQPAFARISDYFGRISILFVSTVFYVVGTIVQACAHNLATFSGGAVLYQ